MTMDRIKNLVNAITKTAANQEKFITSSISSKLGKCVSAHPYDQTLGSMQRVVDKMVENGKTFISRAELTDLYKKLYTKNTKFAQLFSEELAISQEPTSETKVDQKSDILDPYQYTSDAILANALSNAVNRFNKSAPQTYDNALASKAVNNTSKVLDTINLRPTKVFAVDGNSNFIVVQANYETPKGVTSFLVPVQSSSFPTVFVGNAGPVDISRDNVKTYILSNAGKSLNVKASSVLSILTKTASSENKELSQTELALAKYKLSQQKVAFASNSVILKEDNNKVVPDVQIPKFAEFESIEKQLNSPLGFAQIQFGTTSIKNAQDVVIREILNIGYKPVNIKVANSDKSSVFYNVLLDNNIAFTVPVKVTKESVNKPTFLLSNGSLMPLNAQSIHSMLINRANDYKAYASVSNLSSLTPESLVEELRKAAAEQNYAKAEDILNVLEQSGNKQAHSIGMKILIKGFSDPDSLKKEAEHSKCCMMVKSATSQHVLCGHLNLPIHEVYQDELGNCQRMYRKNLKEARENVSFLNQKALLA